MHCTLRINKAEHVLAVDIMHGRDPSNKMPHQLQLNKTKVRLY